MTEPENENDHFDLDHFDHLQKIIKIRGKNLSV